MAKRTIVLECVKKVTNTNKYYEIVEFQDVNDHPGNWSVRCRWGRIEHFKDGNPQSAMKASNVDPEEKDAVTAQILYAKLKKGYVVKLDSSKSTSVPVSLDATNKTHKQNVGKATPERNESVFERTEHVEVSLSNWWSQPMDSIEERLI